MLTNGALQLTYGKLYTFWNIKTVFLVTVLLFEIGSALCGAAIGSSMFIAGRAIAGAGSAGLFSGCVSPHPSRAWYFLSSRPFHNRVQSGTGKRIVKRHKN